jgi:hypothetical protein
VKISPHDHELNWVCSRKNDSGKVRSSSRYVHIILLQFTYPIHEETPAHTHSSDEKSVPKKQTFELHYYIQEVKYPLANTNFQR